MPAFRRRLMERTQRPIWLASPRHLRVRRSADLHQRSRDSGRGLIGHWEACSLGWSCDNKVVSRDHLGQLGKLT